MFLGFVDAAELRVVPLGELTVLVIGSEREFGNSIALSSRVRNPRRIVLEGTTNFDGNISISALTHGGPERRLTP